MHHVQCQRSVNLFTDSVIGVYKSHNYLSDLSIRMNVARNRKKIGLLL